MKKEKPKENNKKNYLWVIIIIIILIVISLLFGINYALRRKNQNVYNTEVNLIKKTNQASFIDINLEKEYLDKMTYSELITSLVDSPKLFKDTTISMEYNNVLLKEGEEITFSLIGENKIKVILECDYNYKNYHQDVLSSREYTINVKDTIFPVLNGVSDKTITVGDNLDLTEGITATDEREGNILVQYEGTVDTKKAGTYKITIYAVDANGNRSAQDMNVTVKNKTSSAPKPSTSKEETGTSSGNNEASSSSSNDCASKAVLTKRGYKSTDKDACEKDKQAVAVASKIAKEILAKGYTRDLDKVKAAAEAVASNYDYSTHTEEGLDYRTPYGVFIKHAASCAGCTRALILVLELMGYQNLTHANENGWTHQWVILSMDGQIGYADGQVGMVGYGTHPYAE